MVISEANLRFSAWGTYIRYFWSNDTFPGTSYLTLSFLSSLTGTGFSVLGPFAGRWADRFGPFIVSLAGGLGCGLALILGSFSTQTWHILLSQGLMFGCFETLIYLSAVNAVSSWFLRRRGTAFGLAVAGSGIGGFAVTPTAQSLIDALDWRWSLRVIAFVIMGVSSLCSLVYLRVPPSRRRKEIERRASMKSEDWELAKEHAAKSDLRKRPIKIFDITYFKDVNFTILYVSSAIGMFGYFSWFAFSPSYAVQFGISPQTASLILAITNMGSAVGRIALGWAGDKLGYLNAYVFCQVMTPVICLFWPLATAPGGLFAIGLLYGLFAGA